MLSPASEQHPLKREMSAALDLVAQAFRRFEADAPGSFSALCLPSARNMNLSSASTLSAEQRTTRDAEAQIALGQECLTYSSELIQIWSQALVKVASFSARDLLPEPAPPKPEERSNFLRAEEQARRFTDSLATLIANLSNAARAERSITPNQDLTRTHLEAAHVIAKDLYGPDHFFVAQLRAKLS